MTDQEDNINLGKIVFDDNNQERKSWACLGQTCSRSLIVLLSQLFCHFVNHLWFLWRIHLSKISDQSTVWVGILCSAAGYILPSPDYEQVNFYKKSSLYFIGWSFRNWKIAADLQLAKSLNISTKV